MAAVANAPEVTCLSKNKWQVTHKGLKWIFGSQYEAEEKAAELLNKKKKRRK